MKKVLPILLLLFTIVIQDLNATHLVGGEFELVHLDGFRYRLNQIQYFDFVNGNRVILNDENVIQAYIYAKADNQLMQIVDMQKISQEDVPYTNLECAIGELETLRLFFTATLTLDPERYNDQEGYYVVWERCCRNNNIDNIVLLQDNTVGQTFYLEFPAVVDENGEPFIDSTPVLFPPLSDYACVDQLYYADFSGSDIDGDSLVYSMVNPLDSSTDDPVPPPSPRNRQVDVPWLRGISTDNQIPGIQPLSISTEGLMTVIPQRAGLYVFAVKVEEFRDGRKIGETRRDFQMLVIDCEAPGIPPETFVRTGGTAGSIFADSLELTLTYEDPDKCLELLITDQDIPEDISIRIRPINFSNSDVNSLLGNIGSTELNGDTLAIEFCLPDCPYTLEQPYILELIAQDDACSLPLSDTMRLIVTIVLPENQKPVVSTDLAGNSTQVNFDELINFTAFATDPEGDQVSICLEGNGFDPAALGISFTEPTGQGSTSSELNWQLECGEVNLLDQDEFELFFIAKDSTTCGQVAYDTVTVDVTFNAPTNEAPILSLGTGNDIVIKIGEEVVIPLTGSDADNDNITLTLNDQALAEALGISFDPVTGQGQVSSSFSWSPECAALGPNFDQTLFPFTFNLVDANCASTLIDQQVVNIRIEDGQADFQNFTPPNVFTPNNDGKNDFFSLEDLPENNCANQFEMIQIFNRWGKEVYSSTDRGFKWTGEEVSSGAYYYTIKFTNRDLNGVVTIVI